MANDMANDAQDLGNEPTPLFDRVINELGNPVPAEPIDRSYEAIVAIAEASRSTGRVKDAGHAKEGGKGAVPSLPAPAQSADSPASIAG
jgi:hypothetical protein